jgi:hypothetical protein
MRIYRQHEGFMPRFWGFKLSGIGWIIWLSRQARSKVKPVSLLSNSPEKLLRGLMLDTV